MCMRTRACVCVLVCVGWEWRLQLSGHDIIHVGVFDCASGLQPHYCNKGMCSHFLIKAMTEKRVLFWYIPTHSSNYAPSFVEG